MSERQFSTFVFAMFFLLLVGCGDKTSTPTNNTNNVNNVTNNVNNGTNNLNNENNQNNVNNTNNTNGTNNTNNTNGCVTGFGPDRDFDGVEDDVDVDPDDPFDFLTWSSPGSHGHAEMSVSDVQQTSWDGRLWFGVRADTNQLEYTVQAFRPTMVDVDQATLFADGVTHSAPFDFAPFDASLGNGPLAVFQATSDLPDPTLANPYRSDAAGSPSLDAGTHATYKLGIIGVEDAPANSPHAKQLTLNRATVIVADPDGTAVVSSATIDDTSLALGSGADNLFGSSPAVSLDGRLVVWSGPPQNQYAGNAILYSFNPTPQDATGWSAPANITAMYSTHGAGAAVEAMVDGVPFSDKYPFAKQALRDTDGVTLAGTDMIPGDYPTWSPDGTEVLFSSVATFGGEYATGVVVVGARTGWALQHLDGAINPSRSTLSSTSGVIDNTLPESAALDSSYGLHVLGSGETLGVDGYRRDAKSPLFLSTSMWNPFVNQPTQPLPKVKQPHTYGMFVSQRWVETPVHHVRDGHYVLYLPMNEHLVSDRAAIARLENGTSAAGDPFRQDLRQSMNYDPTTTPDLSGNFQHATLNGGAAFPYEYHDAQTTWDAYWNARIADPNLPPSGDGVAGDVIEGVVGNAIYFVGGSTVTAVIAEPDRLTARGVTIQFWVKPFVNAEQDLLRIGDQDFRIGQMADGTIFATAGLLNAVGSTEALVVDAWNFVSLTIDDDFLALEVNHVETLGTRNNALPLTNGVVTVGPGDVTATATAVMMIDELSISDVARTKSERRLSSLSRRSEPTLVGSDFGVRGPLALLPAYAPGDVVPSAELQALGQALFESEELSNDRSMACATCHDATKGFADNEVTAVGVFGRSNARNSQTAYNRMFGTRQFWDGRAASLEAQSLGPIQAQTEMDLSLDDAVARVNESDVLRPMIAAAYGTMCIDEERLARAIGAYDRTIVSPEAIIESRALTPEEHHGRALFFGKARCVSCHSGANFSDESFHNIGIDIAEDSDRGRFLITDRRADLGLFKTPTLRELNHTGPYFHNGSFANLDLVVSFYNNGGESPNNQDVAIRKLGLTQAERDALVTYLKGLSSP